MDSETALFENGFRNPVTVPAPNYNLEEPVSKIFIVYLPTIYDTNQCYD